MSSLRTRFVPRLNSLAVGAVLGVLVGTSAGLVVAATATYTGPLTGCLKPGGAVYKIAQSATTPKSPCLATETKITIGNAPGPSGAPGAFGSPGPSGAPGAAVCSGFPHGGTAPGVGIIDWHGCNLYVAYLANATLAYANLSNANLSAANLLNANLNWANLTGANLTGANLGCGFCDPQTGVMVYLADLTNADFTGAGGTPANHAWAIYHNTTCPDTTVKDTDCWAP